MAEAADPLSRYNAKRDFAKTAEPRGERAKAKGDLFIVQKHDATRLHWDLRLEIDGDLKSWAVKRGPSGRRPKSMQTGGKSPEPWRKRPTPSAAKPPSDTLPKPLSRVGNGPKPRAISSSYRNMMPHDCIGICVWK